MTYRLRKYGFWGWIRAWNYFNSECPSLPKEAKIKPFIQIFLYLK